MKTLRIALTALTLVAGLALIDGAVPVAHADTLTVDNTVACSDATGVPAYCTIQAAIGAASDGDTIHVVAGTYAEQLVVVKALTLEGEAGVYPSIQPALDSANKYDTVIKVRADNVTIRGFDISNALGVVDTGSPHIEHHAIWDGAWTLGPSGLTVDDCIIHDIEHGVRSYGPNLTVTNCEMYNLRRSGVHASGPYQNQPLPMTIQYNWFHDWHDYYKEGAGVHVKYDSRVGKVSYNYISGMRMGIAYYYGGPKSSYGQQIVFEHNTIDLDYDLGSGPVAMTMGFSFWGTGANADNVIVKDNILANARWYGIYQEGATIQGAITVDNNLFYNNYWDYWPDYQYPYQWFGDDTRAQAGWTGGAGGFTFTNNVTTQDPLFALEGIGPEAQWALLCGSPALKAATDGTNTGAWQGQPVCVVEVEIDVKPGSDPNSINPKSKGKIPVAILSTMDFHAPGGVDPGSLTFGPTGDEASLAFCNPSPEDVDGNGYDDLVCHFDTQATGFQCGDTEGILKGYTVDDVPIEGSDSVRIVPCK
jgi:hypothetical protein